MPEVKPHYEYIDRLKGFTMLLVVIGHLSIFTFGNYISDIGCFLSQFHMQLFFFLSGIVISGAVGWRKCGKKMLRFLLPVATVGLFLSVSIGKGINGILFDKFRSGYWYLVTLAEFYVVVTLLSFNSSQKHRGGVLLDALFLLAPTFLCRYLTDFNQTSVGLVVGTDKWFYWQFFFGGVLCRKYSLLKLLGCHNIIYTLTFVGAIPVMYAAVHVNGHFGWLVPWCFILPIVYIFRHREHADTKLERFFSQIGRKSIDVYIYHYFFLIPVGAFNLKSIGKWLGSTNNVLLEFLLCAVIAAFIAWMCLGIGYVVRQSNLLKKVVYGEI